MSKERNLRLVIDEELAKDRLEELGFNVGHVDDFEFLGWSIEQNGDGWGVWELHDHAMFGKSKMSLSGRMSSMEACIVWLVDHAAGLILKQFGE